MLSSSDTYEKKLDDLVELWHTSDSEVSLIEFLGVKPEVYAAWVEGCISAKDLLDRSVYGTA